MTNSSNAVSSSEITNAYAWLSDQTDDREQLLIEQGADMTALCRKMGNGVWQSPFPVLVDRDESDEVDLDGDDVDFDCDCAAIEMTGPDPSEPNDEYSAMAERNDLRIALNRLDDIADEIDAEDALAGFDLRATLERIENFLEERPLRLFNAPFYDTSVAEDNRPRIEPVSVSTIRRTGRKTVIFFHDTIDHRAWKATTTARRQYLRHKTGHPRTCPSN